MVGKCVGGMHACNADGMSYGMCINEIVPGAEDCEKTGDEDCDGYSCSETPWAFGAGDSAWQQGYSVARDDAGNTYAAGDFPGSVQFMNQQPMIAAGQTDIYLVKIGPTGVPVWSNRFGGATADAVLDVAADATGVYMLTAGAVDIGGLGSGLTLARFDTLGGLVWSRSCNRTVGAYLGDGARPGGMAISGNGIVFAVPTSAGSMSCTPGANPTTASTFTAAQGTVVKYTSAGDLSWTQTYSSSTLSISDLAADPGGNLWLTGTFKGTTNFGCGPGTASGTGDAFLTKLDVSGACAVARNWPSVDAIAVATDANGGPILSGQANATTIDFSYGTQPLVGSVSDLVLAHFDGAGGHVWSKRFSGALGNDVAVDSKGNVVVVGGRNASTMNFGGGLLDKPGFVAKLSAGSGQHLWSRGYGGSILSVDVTDRLSVTGYFAAAGSFGTTVLTPAGGADALFMAIDP